MKLFRLLIVFTAAIALQSCGGDSTVSKANNKIDPTLRAIIKEKNDSLLDALSNSNNKALLRLASPEFTDDMYRKLDKVIWPFRKGQLTMEYTVFDEYHNKHASFPKNEDMESKDHSYTFKFTNKHAETYVSLLRFTSNVADNYLLTIMYARIGKEFKIIHTDLGGLGLYEKTAHDYYTMAKDAKEKGFMLDAITYMNTAASLSDPSGTMLVYDEAEKIPQYVKLWKPQVDRDFKLPTLLENVKTKPSVIDISTAKNNDEISQVFMYTTKIPITDTISLRKEYEEIRVEVKKLFPGINFNKRYMYYRAYNGKPASREDVAFYGFTDKKAK